jgi:hypothetical protein
VAGFYPDVPGRRMAWDRDGTVGIVTNVTFGTLEVVLSQAQRDNGNDESGATLMHNFSGGAGRGYAFIFPEPRDVVGVYVGSPFYNTGNSGLNLHWSDDTTNGMDGTWTAVSGLTLQDGALKAGMRNAILGTSLSAAAGIRFTKTGGVGTTAHNISNVHIYGDPASGEAPNRLRFWHPTSDAEAAGAFFDWGDVPADTTLSRDIRVKNPSGTLTAHDVTITSEALTPGSPSHASMHTFSLNNVDYFASLNIGDLTPGEVSTTIRVRRETPAGAQLGLWWTRMVAQAGSWS